MTLYVQSLYGQKLAACHFLCLWLIGYSLNNDTSPTLTAVTFVNCQIGYL
nr:hypothetical protein [Bacteroides gallinaceum]